MDIEFKIDEGKIAEAISNDLRRHNLINEHQNITIIYSPESEDIIYTVKETAKLIKTNQSYVYELIKAGHLPVLKLGSIKIRREALLKFLQDNEGNDLTNPFEVKKLEI